MPRRLFVPPGERCTPSEMAAAETVARLRTLTEAADGSTELYHRHALRLQELLEEARSQGRVSERQVDGLLLVRGPPGPTFRCGDEDAPALALAEARLESRKWKRESQRHMRDIEISGSQWYSREAALRARVSELGALAAAAQALHRSAAAECSLQQLCHAEAAARLRLLQELQVAQAGAAALRSGELAAHWVRTRSREGRLRAELCALSAQAARREREHLEELDEVKSKLHSQREDTLAAQQQRRRVQQQVDERDALLRTWAESHDRARVELQAEQLRAEDQRTEAELRERRLADLVESLRAERALEPQRERAAVEAAERIAADRAARAEEEHRKQLAASVEAARSHGDQLRDELQTAHEAVLARADHQLTVALQRLEQAHEELAAAAAKQQSAEAELGRRAEKLEEAERQIAAAHSSLAAAGEREEELQRELRRAAAEAEDLARRLAETQTALTAAQKRASVCEAACSPRESDPPSPAGSPMSHLASFARPSSPPPAAGMMRAAAAAMERAAILCAAATSPMADATRNAMTSPIPVAHAAAATSPLRAETRGAATSPFALQTAALRNAATSPWAAECTAALQHTATSPWAGAWRTVATSPVADTPVQSTAQGAAPMPPLQIMPEPVSPQPQVVLSPHGDADPSHALSAALRAADLRSGRGGGEPLLGLAPSPPRSAWHFPPPGQFPPPAHFPPLGHGSACSAAPVTAGGVGGASPGYGAPSLSSAGAFASPASGGGWGSSSGGAFRHVGGSLARSGDSGGGLQPAPPSSRPSRPRPPPLLRAGDSVLVSGLLTHTAFNGRRGVIEFVDPGGEQCAVNLCGLSQPVAVRSEHLSLVEP
eukprot:TRINITY_DN6342_c0_g1_i4.p1 TRINITY_DN6342_c0_g1~~TRINITY_DN6342_c0_g1_i4.p1  ORF type:complete len:862 (+),score=217.31 TRINITY_DN6342_c0_g1_i4:71-2587(+)